MKTNHRTVLRITVRAIVLFLCIITLAWPQPALAQSGAPNGPMPPQPGRPPQHGPDIDPLTGEKLQMGPLPQNGIAAIAPLATGGPDYYGYSWSDAPGVNWIDARSGGFNTGYNNNSSCWPYSYALPFDFKFYENTYSSVFISQYGYLTFTDGNWCDSQSRVPSQSAPNNVIAPYWSPMYFGSGSGVYYKSGQDANGRYFVVEWYQMSGGYPGGGTAQGTYTFEAILYESGNIVFQYQAMSYGTGNYYCAGAGIEDIRGVDGLETSWCGPVPSPKTITITRPAPASRVLVHPTNYGAFAGHGEVASVTLPLMNIGDVGDDIFDLQPSCAWPVTLLDANTKTPLVDNNSNGLVDTGSLYMGASFPVEVQVQMPVIANVGTSASCSVTVIPARSPAKSRTARVDVAVPAPFAEVDGTYNDGAMNLSIIEPQVQYNRSYAGGTYGYSPAVAETPTGNYVYAWSKGRCGASCSQYMDEIYYTILDKTGRVVKGTTMLADLSGYAPYTYDESPAITVAPDGMIGIAFSRVRYNSNYQVNLNIYLALLTPAGNLLGIANLTNYNIFANWGSYNLVETNDPTIAATSDNRFTVAWDTYNDTATGNVRNIASAVVSTAGALVQGATNITSDTPGSGDGYYYPSVAASGTNAVFVYRRTLGPDIYYQVRSSAGASVKASTNLTNNGNTYFEYRPDIARLSDGHFLVAWETNRIQYLVMDETYTPVAPVQDLDMLSQDGEGNVSVAADNNGHGILSWVDWANAGTIYYALVNSAGQTLTNSMAMKTSPDGHSVSYTGNNVTSHAMAAPTTTAVDLYLKALSPFPVIPTTTQTLKVELGNLGSGVAADVTVTLTNTSGLALGSPSPAASCVGNTCTWTFTAANLGYMGKGTLSIPVTMGSVPAGTSYTLTMHISSAEADAFPANNDLTITVVSGYQYVLPAMMR